MEVVVAPSVRILIFSICVSDNEIIFINNVKGHPCHTTTS